MEKPKRSAKANGHANGGGAGVQAAEQALVLSPDSAAASAEPAAQREAGGPAPLPPNAVDLRGLSVLIATPCHDGTTWQEYTLGIAKTQMALAHYGVNVMLMMLPGESVITKARNALASRFLKSAATHMLFIDADMGWEPDAVLRLLASGKKLCGVAGRRKCDPPSYCTLLDPIHNESDPVSGLMRAHSIGTGFMLISREVLEQMAAHDPENFYVDYASGEKIWNFFENRVHKGHFWSEDYVFCLKYLEIGGQVWLDPNSSLKHCGVQVFEGAFKEEVHRFGRNFVNHHAVGDVADILGRKKSEVMPNAHLSGELYGGEHIISGPVPNFGDRGADAQPVEH